MMKFLCCTAVLLVALAPSVEGDCTFGGKKICEGAVTKEKFYSVKICLDGRLKWRQKTQVKKGYPVVGKDTGPGKDCKWYGETYCKGDTVEDLYRWWFQVKCSNGRMSVQSRSWSAVVNDPRYKAFKAGKV